MSALARTTEMDCDTRAANEDCINGGSRTRTKFCYDANGNMLSQTNPRGVTTAVWTGFNQPSSITGALGSSQFYYNADHQRYMQQAVYSGAVENTIYIGGLLEKMSNSSGTAYRLHSSR
jgi:YD repeat-containing protein